MCGCVYQAILSEVPTLAGRITVSTGKTMIYLVNGGELTCFAKVGGDMNLDILVNFESRDITGLTEQHEKAIADEAKIARADMVARWAK